MGGGGMQIHRARASLLGTVRTRPLHPHTYTLWGGGRGLWCKGEETWGRALPWQQAHGVEGHGIRVPLTGGRSVHEAEGGQVATARKGTQGWQ